MHRHSKSERLDDGHNFGSRKAAKKPTSSVDLQFDHFYKPESTIPHVGIQAATATNLREGGDWVVQWSVGGADTGGVCDLGYDKRNRLAAVVSILHWRGVIT